MAQENQNQNQNQNQNSKQIFVTENGYCSIKEWSEYHSLKESTVVGLCKKHKARVVKIGDSRLAIKTELDRAYQSEITAQDNAVQKKKAQAEKIAAYKKKAMEMAVKFGPKGLLESNPEDFDNLLKLAAEKDTNITKKYKGRSLDPAEERALLKQQLDELNEKYRRINL